MKQLATIAALLTLTACGGSDNPLAVVQDDPVQVEQNSETIDSSPVLVPNMAISTPVVNQEPVQQPVQEQNNPVPVAGECIDTDPVNDGWGFNGATSCQLPIEPVVTPDCVGEGYGYGWENDASCVYVNQPIEQTMPEAKTGTWECTAYVPNGYNYTMQIDENGFDDEWTVAEAGTLATTSQSNPQAGYHQCVFLGSEIEPTQIEIENAPIVAQDDWTQYECSSNGTIYLSDSNTIYDAGGIKIGEWSSTPESLDFNLNGQVSSHLYEGENLVSSTQTCTYIKGPSRSW